MTVEDELINIQNYFQIQRYRFGDELSLNIRFMDNEAEIRTLQIPKLTLQPIIENSVFHGLEKKREKGMRIGDLRSDREISVYQY